MDESLREYIQSLLPANLPDGRKLVEEGRAMGRTIQVPRTPFLEKHGCRTYLEYRKKRLAEGKQTWQLLVGLATLEDEIAAIKEIDAFNQRHAGDGMEISGVQSIPSQIVGLPHEYWGGFPKQTSYEMYNPEDWKAHTAAAPIQVAWQDFHLACPAALQTTVNALEAGTDRLGTFSTLIWEYTGYHDEIQRFSDMVRSIGMVSAKRDLDIDVVTYPEDGIPGYFLDVVSWVGYTMIEEYVTAKLCGALFSVSFGGLLTEVQPRMAFALAMHKLFSTPDHPAVVYFNGGTLDQLAEDINCNFGTGVQEMLMQVLFNLKYQVPIIISPVAVTERLRTPSLEELIDIASAGMRAETKAREWLPMMDFTPVEELSDLMIEKGTAFFRNAMAAFADAGVDLEDPLQIILVLKHFNPVRFEQSFHPSVREFGSYRPYCPSQLGRQTMEMKDAGVAELKGQGLSLEGRKIVCISADGHSYGLMLIDNVFTEIGARVVNGGVAVEPPAALDLADEEGTDVICISVHCGQCLAYAQTITELARQRHRRYKILMGGKLNALLPGNPLPVDVEDLVRETGVCATNDFGEQVRFILGQ